MSLEERLAAIEARLAALETRERSSLAPAPSAGREPAAPPAVEPAAQPATEPPTAAPAAPPTVPLPFSAPFSTQQGGHRFSAAIVLGWTGASALVLAAAYLVRLGITSGWLTPERQVAGAAMLGLAMVGGGLALRLRDRRYSSLLVAGGIAVLYLTVFGAHLAVGLIDSLSATGLVVAVSALSLGLHALFREPLYVAFALLGSYACPLLVPPGRGTLLDLAIYFTVWNAVYCAYSLRIRRRIVYFAALYLSLLLFDFLWRDVLAGERWEVAALFQLAQFALFTTAIVLFSTRVRPLTAFEAWCHFPALLLFYGVEYATLNEHVAWAAPWAAVGFATALYGAHGLARARLGGRELPSLGLVNAFAVLVLCHAVYLDLLPATWRPLTTLLLAMALTTGVRRAGLLGEPPSYAGAAWPFAAGAAFLFAAGYLQLLWNWGEGETVFELPLAALYPLPLYAAYFRAGVHAGFLRRLVPLTVAHVQLLVACGLLVYRALPDEGTVGRLWLSFAWACVGTVFLVRAKLSGDRMLARSTLGIFALFAAKVLLFDLAEATPLVRIGCLLILGISLYAGGWIYRRIFEPVHPPVTPPSATGSHT